jgi:putative aldouronate transport system permease protein
MIIISASFTDNLTIVREGYSLFPKVLSLDAYTYLGRQISRIGTAYLVTVGETVVGVTVGLTITSLLAYPLSRTDLPGRRGFMFFVFFTMLFNAGLVPTYMVYTKLFNLKNSWFALLVPWLLTNGFNVLLMRSFFSGIPVSLIESAKIDGYGEFQIFTKIIIPLSTPIVSTMAMLYMITYWNDWYNGMIFISDTTKYSIQNLLSRILQNAQFIANNASLSTNVTQGVTGSLPLASVRMAMAVIGAMPLILAYPFFQRFLVKGLILGAVKG